MVAYGAPYLAGVEVKVAGLVAEGEAEPFTGDVGIETIGRSLVSSSDSRSTCRVSHSTHAVSGGPLFVAELS